MSLTSDDLADMKQLMTSLLSAQEKRIDARLDAQDEKLDEILNAIGGEFAEQSEQITDHERRITRLEHQAQSV